MDFSIRSIYIYIAAFLGIESSLAFYSFYVFPGAGLLFYSLYLLLYLLYISKGPVYARNSRHAGLFLSCFFVIYIISIFHGFLPVNVEWLILLYGATLLTLSDDVQHKILKVFIKMFTILLALSLIEYLLYAFVGYSIRDVYIERGDRPYHHLVFNVLEYRSFMIIPRFQSLLDEPGMVGTFSALLLAILWKKKGWLIEKTILFVAGVFSFSLAFIFMLSIVALLNSSLKIKHMIIGTVLVIVTYYALQNYIDTLVVARFDREDTFSRTAYKFDKAFSSAWINGDLILGLGATSHKLQTDVDDGNAGVKVWIYQYGIVCLIMMVVVYVGIFYNKIKRYIKPNIHVLSFLLIFWISFYQRSDIEFPYYIIMFFCFPAFYKYEYCQLLNKNEKR